MSRRGSAAAAVRRLDEHHVAGLQRMAELPVDRHIDLVVAVSSTGSTRTSELAGITIGRFVSM